MIPEIEKSAAYKDNGLIAITFDEAPQVGLRADPSACCGNPKYPNLAATTTGTALAINAVGAAATDPTTTSPGATSRRPRPRRRPAHPLRRRRGRTHDVDDTEHHEHEPPSTPPDADVHSGDTRSRPPRRRPRRQRRPRRRPRRSSLDRPTRLPRRPGRRPGWPAADLALSNRTPPTSSTTTTTSPCWRRSRTCSDSTARLREGSTAAVFDAASSTAHHKSPAAIRIIPPRSARSRRAPRRSRPPGLRRPARRAGSARASRSTSGYSDAATATRLSSPWRVAIA